MAFSVDLLGEACVSIEEAEAYQKRYLDLIETLPSEVAADRVEAHYADGILTLTLPKAEEAKPRQIAVKS